MLMMLVLLLAKSLQSLGRKCRTCSGFQAREIGERAWKELQLLLMMLSPAPC